MALARVTSLLTVLFAMFLILIWGASCTPFFNKERIKEIMKWIAMGAGAFALTTFTFILIFAFDHTV